MSSTVWARLHQAVHPQAPVAQRLQHLGLAGDLQSFRGQDVVGVELQRAGGGDLRVELAQRPGRGVTRVGERLLALGEQALVELVESGGVHHDLATQGEERRHRPLVVAQPQGDARDGADVGGDALALAAVAPGRGLQQGAVAVDHLDGGAVQLGLQHVLDGKFAQSLAHALVKAAQRRFGLVGFERQHGGGVLDAREAVDRLAGDALGGGVLGDQVRELFLQRDQLAEELVVGRVRDFRRVFDVVEIVVVADLGPQSGDPRGGFVAIHDDLSG